MRTTGYRAAIASLALLLAAPLAASMPLAAAAASLPTLPTADAQFDAGSLHVSRFRHGDPGVLLAGLAAGPGGGGRPLPPSRAEPSRLRGRAPRLRRPARRDRAVVRSRDRRLL